MPVPEGWSEYKRREYCKDVRCPVQTALDAAGEKTPEGEELRTRCRTGCVHTTWEFHHWLIERGYEVVKPADRG